MQVAVKKLLDILPFLFGVGFIAPLLEQTMAAWAVPAPFGMSRIAFALAVGATWGLAANLRGRWL